MIIKDYNGLIKALEDYSVRDDVNQYFNDFIKMTEVQIDTGLKISLNSHRATLVVGTGDRFIPKPSNYAEMRTLRIKFGDFYESLEYYSPDRLEVTNRPGVPFGFTVGHQIELNCRPDQNYTLEMTYWKNISPLTADNPVNDTITKYPGLYLNGCLSELYRYAQDDASADKHGMIFKYQLSNAHNLENRGRYGQSLRMRSGGPTP